MSGCCSVRPSLPLMASSSLSLSLSLDEWHRGRGVALARVRRMRLEGAGRRTSSRRRGGGRAPLGSPAAGAPSHGGAAGAPPCRRGRAPLGWVVSHRSDTYQAAYSIFPKSNKNRILAGYVSKPYRRRIRYAIRHLLDVSVLHLGSPVDSRILSFEISMIN